jgi:pimeloyl-ACP methyl ester carboxylesterase
VIVHSSYHRPEHFAESRRADVIEVPGADHSLWLSRPDVVARAVRDPADARPGAQGPL